MFTMHEIDSICIDLSSQLWFVQTWFEQQSMRADREQCGSAFDLETVKF